MPTSPARARGPSVTEVQDEVTWDDIVRSLPAHTIYQAWSWGEIRRASGRAVRRFALFADRWPVAAVQVEIARRRGGIRTAYAPRGPLWRDGEHLAALVTGVAEALAQSGVLVWKVDPQRDEGAARALAQLGFRPVARPDATFGGILPRRTAEVALASPEELFSRLSPDARRRVRRSARLGLEVEVSEEEPALARLWPLLASKARNRGFSLPGRGALERMLASWCPRGQGALLLARCRGEVVGGAVVSFFGDEAYGHFLASDDGYRSWSVDHALYWRGFLEACRRGARRFDLGGVRSADDTLARFKRQFGAKVREWVGEWDLPLTPVAGLALWVGRGRWDRWW